MQTKSTFNPRQLLIVFTILTALTCTLYALTLQTPFQFDSKDMIEENYAIRDVTDIYKIWNSMPARFVTNMTLAFNYHLSGKAVLSYRILNLLIHIAASFSLYLLVLLLFQTPALRKTSSANYRDKIALAACLIFAAHPIQTMCVSYVVQRGASLATFLYLTAMILYIQCRLKQNLVYYGLALVITVLGIFAKQTVVTLPIALLLVEFCLFDETKAPLLKRFTGLMPFLATIAILPLLGLSGVNLQPGATGITVETTLFSRHDYLLTQFNVIRTYLRLLILPIAQNIDYDYPIARSLSEVSTLLSLLLHLAIVGLGILLYKKQRLVAFCVFWFYLSLSVESSIIPIKDVIFEYRLYLPMAAFTLLVATLLIGYTGASRKALMSLSLILVCLMTLTVRRNYLWSDEIRLWQDVIKKSPQKPRPFSYLGNAVGRLGEYDWAIEACGKAVELQPLHWQSLNCLGAAYMKKEDYAKAIPYFETTLEINPRHTRSITNIAICYGSMGNHDKAIEYALKALEVSAVDLTAHNNLGVAYLAKGNLKKAAEHYYKALERDPYFDDAYRGLAVTMVRMGNQEALKKIIKKIRQLDKHELADQLTKLVRE